MKYLKKLIKNRKKDIYDGRVEEPYEYCDSLFEIETPENGNRFIKLEKP